MKITLNMKTNTNLKITDLEYEDNTKFEDDLKYKDNLKFEDDVKYEYDQKYEDNFYKCEDNLKSIKQNIPNWTS